MALIVKQERSNTKFLTLTQNHVSQEKHCVTQYELAISVYHSRCCHISDQYKGGEHDLTMFCKDKSKAHIQKLSAMGKKAIAYKGYQNKAAVDEKEFFSYPDYMSSKELNAFKTQA
eukprot:10606345-Ditylum_brightwellii.AAC.2